MDIILSLDSPQATLEVPGGKGTSLSRMVRAGFPVPPGFLMTTAAYHAFVKAKGLEERIIGISRLAPTADPTSLRAPHRPFGVSSTGG
jgi:phosphoenolpyruvate synthase/pyruvate phosphate dikinase